MSSKCDVVRIDNAIIEIRNICFGAPFNKWFNIAPYIEGDKAGAYAYTSSSGTKANSSIDELWLNSYSGEISGSMKIRTGTALASYMQYIKMEIETNGVEKLNLFEMRVTNEQGTVYRPSVVFQVNTIPFENVVSKEYITDFMIHSNAKSIFKNVPDPIDSVDDIDLAPTGVLNVDGENLDISYDTDTNGITFQPIFINVYDNANNLLSEYMVDDIELTGQYTTTDGIYETGENYTIRMYGYETGYSNLVLVGETSITV